MKYLYGDTQPQPSAREKANTALARKAAREGFVLLKNDGALPLQTKNIALYGMGARKTVKGGTGSGAVQERHSVSIAEGLRNAGYSITTQQYLDDYDALYAAEYKVWHDDMDIQLAALPPMQAIGQAAILGGFMWPSGRSVSRQDIDDSATDTAIYVLARQAGEGKDRRLEKGDWYLTDTERKNLETVADAYANTILVINAGGQIDLAFLDEIKGINSVVFYAQGGMEGGNALADVLSGAHNFCGKLADTWAMKYEDIPYAMEYSHLNGNLENEAYAEGIYVGYRYFDAFNVAPRFAFGFGLSYTSFAFKTLDVVLNGTNVTAALRITNTGTTHAGKEVVQAYLACPATPAQPEAKRLVTFTKTGLLTPGASEEVSLTFSLAEGATYDEAASAWVLLQGEYGLLIGNSSADFAAVATITLPQRVVLGQCRPCCAPPSPITELAGKARPLPAGAKRLVADPAAFASVVHDYSENDLKETAEETALLDDFTTEQLVSLLVGGDLHAQSPAIHGPLGSTGRTSLVLGDKGIDNVAFCDGPAGLNIMEHVKLTESGIEKPTSIPEKYNFGSFAAFAKHMIATEGTDVYRYATAWPVELLLAQTWDVNIMEQVGRGMGAELHDFGITLLLAPGMNIHRNPLCGRNFEYFSEDPLLTGKLAAAQIRGTQSYDGIGLTVKHFCCNNQEDNRLGVSADVSERALREIYLKGFAIAVAESQPLAVMSSYNRLNGTYTPNHRELLQDILRCEWGFEGLVMTDWGSCAEGHGEPALCPHAGNDLIMPGGKRDAGEIIAALESGALTKKEARQSALRVLRLVKNSAIYKEA